MSNMSFLLTTDQIRHQTKTVTRRIGWKKLYIGAIVQPVVKGQGLRRGETVEKIGGPIRVVAVRREPLGSISALDLVKEGFPDLTVAQFIELFCETNGCKPSDTVTRIEFEYTEPVQS